MEPQPVHSFRSFPAALDGMVVLDVAGLWGGYCGKLFADLGAEVILVEPPSGSRGRHHGPWIHGKQHVSDASLSFQYQNTNKKSIVLDLDTEAGKLALRKLATRADLLIESFTPGVMAERGIGYEDLRKIAPHLVVLSLSAFGQTGPYAHWQSSDLVAMAMGGMLYLGGYVDSPPMLACGEQSIGAVNLFGAVAAMAALYESEASQEGQHIDVSMQECIVMGMENSIQFYELEGMVRKRNAGEQRLAGTGVFECRDGYIYLMAGGVGGNRFWPLTTNWLIDEGVANARELQNPCWQDDNFLNSKAAKQRFLEIFGPFAQAHNKSELEEKGRRRRIPIAPIKDPSELDTDQRKHRNYFVDIMTVDGSTKLGMPGAPYHFSNTPWTLQTPAPSLGQHTVDVLRSKGFSSQEISTLTHKEILA